jgi:hypothetical protein
MQVAYLILAFPVPVFAFALWVRADFGFLCCAWVPLMVAPFTLEDW